MSAKPDATRGGGASLPPRSPINRAPLPTGWRVPLSLLILAGPIIATMVSRTVMSFVDFAMVSGLGEEATAAIMPAGLSVWCLICFGVGIITVTNTFVSQSLGKGELAECSRYTWQGLYLAAVIGVVVLPVWWVAPGYFALADHAPEVQRLEVIYFRISLLGVLPAVAANVVSNFFTGIHKPAIGLYAAVTANVFNIGANYVLIYGKLGFPAMGIGGAAWATAAASALQCALLAAVWLGPGYAKRFASRTTWRPSMSRVRRIVRVGLPVGIQFESDVFGFTIFTVFMVGHYGTAQLAANNLVFKFLEVSFMPVVGLGIALSSAVGKAIGEKEPAYARLVVRWAVAGALIYMVGINAIYLAFRHQLPGLMLSDPAPEVVSWSATLFVICAVFAAFDAFGITLTGALRGAGDTFWPGMASFVLSATVFMGGGYAMMRLAPGLESIGPWIAATAFICSYGVVASMRWWYGPWEKIDLFADKKTTARDQVIEPAVEPPTAEPM